MAVTSFVKFFNFLNVISYCKLSSRSLDRNFSEIGQTEVKLDVSSVLSFV